MIKLDKTQHSIVVLCTSCPSWRVMASTPAGAHEFGRLHNRTHHPNDLQAASAARQAAYRARKAAEGS